MNIPEGLKAGSRGQGPAPAGPRPPVGRPIYPKAPRRRCQDLHTPRGVLFHHRAGDPVVFTALDPLAALCDPYRDRLSVEHVAVGGRARGGCAPGGH